MKTSENHPQQCTLNCHSSDGERLVLKNTVNDVPYQCNVSNRVKRVREDSTFSTGWERHFEYNLIENNAYEYHSVVLYAQCTYVHTISPNQFNICLNDQFKVFNPLVLICCVTMHKRLLYMYYVHAMTLFSVSNRITCQQITK